MSLPFTSQGPSILSIWPFRPFQSQQTAAPFDEEPAEPLDEINESFEQFFRITPEASFATVQDLTPPSKCALRRNPQSLVHQESAQSSTSSSDSIIEQMRSWSSQKLSISVESELKVRDLLWKTPNDAPLFSSRLIQEFKENYDIPLSEEEAETLDAEHILMKAQWKNFQAAINKGVSKPISGGKNPRVAGSPDTATTAPPSFSTDQTPSHSDEEADISAITTEQDANSSIQNGFQDKTLIEVSLSAPTVVEQSPSKPRTHLDGLKQLLWPEVQTDEKAQFQEEDTYDQFSASATQTTSSFTFLQPVSFMSCCGGLLMTGAPSPRRSEDRFASRSDDDSYLIMDTSVGSFLYLDEDDHEQALEPERNEEEYQSVFDAPELGTSVKQMAKFAYAANCSHPSFDDDRSQSQPVDTASSIVSNDQSTLQDAVNFYFLSAERKVPSPVTYEEDAVNRSSLSSFGSGELLNEFYTLDESSCGDHNESAVSESSIVTTPRKNSSPEETISTSSTVPGEDDDDEEPPPLTLSSSKSRSVSSQSHSIASFEDNRFLC